jgi:hypothetical protein
MQTFRYIEYLGTSKKERYVVQLRQFTQIDGGNTKGAIAINKYEIGKEGAYIVRRETQKSPIGNNGVINYPDGGPYFFKMPLKVGKQTWAFWEDGERTVFTSEFVVLKIGGRSYNTVKVIEKHYDKQCVQSIEPINTYYVKGVGVWMVTLGKEGRLYNKLRDGEELLVDGENGEIEQERKSSSSSEKPVRTSSKPKAVFRKSTDGM